MKQIQEAKLGIKDLAQRVQVIENFAWNDLDFLFVLNEHQYEFESNYNLLVDTCK